MDKPLESLRSVAERIASQSFGNLSPSSDVVCGICNDTGTELTETGARTCACVRQKLQQRRIAEKDRKLARIDARYAGVTLAGLTPRAELHPDQGRYIARMRAAPFENYYICGNNDTGKTHLLWALYESAVSAGRGVAAGTLFDMLESMKSLFRLNHRRNQGESTDPETNPFANLQGAAPFSAFIDDVDKARPTEFAAEFFFSYVDALYRYKHQIVVTSQLDPEKRVDGRDSLIDHFEKADARYGIGIVRRLVNDETNIVRLF